MSPAVSLPAIRERPILFSSPMIHALRDGRKTVTRRICRIQPEPWKSHSAEGGCQKSDWKPAPCDDGTWDLLSTHAASSVPGFGRCPYGAPGDRLWVRESCWLKSFEVILGNTIEFGEDVEHLGREWAAVLGCVLEPDEPPHIWYAADGERPDLPEWAASSGTRWERRNSIHMPKWASRISLELTSVRIERLHDITESEALAEGIHRKVVPTFFDAPRTSGAIYEVEGEQFATARTAFEFLWDGLNGERCPWEVNPWLWVLGFRVLTMDEVVPT